MKYKLSRSSEDQEECQRETGGFYGQNLHKACKIPKNLNFSGLFIKLSQAKTIWFFLALRNTNHNTHLVRAVTWLVKCTESQSFRERKSDHRKLNGGQCLECFDLSRLNCQNDGIENVEKFQNHELLNNSETF